MGFFCSTLGLQNILFIKNSTLISKDPENYVMFIQPEKSTNIGLKMSYNSKIFQSCSSKETKPYTYNGKSHNLTIHVINTGFELDINITHNIKKTRSKNEFHYTMKETCTANNGISCQRNQRCKNQEKNFLCNESHIYCVKSSYECDGKIDCNNAFTFDDTDEKNCMFPTFKYSIISIVTAFLCFFNLLIRLKHSNSLKQNNMKRYKQD